MATTPAPAFEAATRRPWYAPPRATVLRAPACGGANTARPAVVRKPTEPYPTFEELRRTTAGGQALDGDAAMSRPALPGWLVHQLREHNGMVAVRLCPLPGHGR